MFIFYQQHRIQNRTRINYGLVHKLQIPETFRLSYLLQLTFTKIDSFFSISGKKYIFLANAGKITDEER